MSPERVRSGILPEKVPGILLNQIEAHLLSPVVQAVGEGDVDVLAVLGTDDDGPLALEGVVEGLPNEGGAFGLVLLVELLGVADDVEDAVGGRVGSRFGPQHDLEAFIRHYIYY